MCSGSYKRIEITKQYNKVIKYHAYIQCSKIETKLTQKLKEMRERDKENDAKCQSINKNFWIIRQNNNWHRKEVCKENLQSI